ncbi:MAG TPA: AAA family ATPase [Desulfurococcales archaeon]|nr:AAA family ATPase [Desulfurococcales archaeon]
MKLTIAVSGPPGSGKTTIAKMLAKNLKLRYVSAGSLFRKIAEERGLSLKELSLLAERDYTIDLEIDRRSYEEALKGNVVLDGHLTAWIIRDIADFTIYLTAPLHVRVKRIAERDGRSISEVLIETIVREWSQLKRYKILYGIDIRDTSWFDITLNTAKYTVDEVYEIIMNSLRHLLKNRDKHLLTQSTTKAFQTNHKSNSVWSW